MLASHLLFLKGAIKYEQDELPACKSLVDQCLSDDPDTIISYASISFKDQGALSGSHCLRVSDASTFQPKAHSNSPNAGLEHHRNLLRSNRSVPFYVDCLPVSMGGWTFKNQSCLRPALRVPILSVRVLFHGWACNPNLIHDMLKHYSIANFDGCVNLTSGHQPTRRHRIP